VRHNFGDFATAQKIAIEQTYEIRYPRHAYHYIPVKLFYHGCAAPHLPIDTMLEARCYA
jgi:hypothetical protein